MSSIQILASIVCCADQNNKFNEFLFKYYTGVRLFPIKKCKRWPKGYLGEKETIKINGKPRETT